MNLATKGDTLVGRINDHTCVELVKTIDRNEITSLDTGIELEKERWELGAEG